MSERQVKAVEYITKRQSLKARVALFEELVRAEQEPDFDSFSGWFQGRLLEDWR